MNFSIKELNLMANSIRQDILEIAFKAGGPSHPGPALSCVDIITALYFRILDIDQENPRMEDRDRVILSKGHACPALYSALAERGFFPKDWLYTIRQLNSKLQGHPDMTKTPGIDMTSGSLGYGLSAGLGMALFLKQQGKKSRIFVILGDGETQEGPVWEAAMSAPVLHADNLIAIVDRNHFQSCDAVDEIVPFPNMRKVWEDFGWNVTEINGHDMDCIVSNLEMAYRYRGRPTCIIANTVKGKGVSYMEYDNDWHQKVPSEDQYHIAMKELREELICL
jgi:transketolase